MATTEQKQSTQVSCTSMPITWVLKEQRRLKYYIFKIGDDLQRFHPKVWVILYQRNGDSIKER